MMRKNVRHEEEEKVFVIFQRKKEEERKFSRKSISRDKKPNIKSNIKYLCCYIPRLKQKNNWVEWDSLWGILRESSLGRDGMNDESNSILVGPRWL